MTVTETRTARLKVDPRFVKFVRDALDESVLDCKIRIGERNNDVDELLEWLSAYRDAQTSMAWVEETEPDRFILPPVPYRDFVKSLESRGGAWRELSDEFIGLRTSIDSKRDGVRDVRAYLDCLEWVYAAWGADWLALELERE